MTREEANKLEIGLYILHWQNGCRLYAAVGENYYGDRWFAASNWIIVPSYDWSKVIAVESIRTGVVT